MSAPEAERVQCGWCHYSFPFGVPLIVRAANGHVQGYICPLCWVAVGRALSLADDVRVHGATAGLRTIKE